VSERHAKQRLRAVASLVFHHKVTKSTKRSVRKGDREMAGDKGKAQEFFLFFSPYLHLSPYPLFAFFFVLLCRISLFSCERNPKSENRNPKQIQNSKFKTRRTTHVF
jgi:hypothetical protein